MIHHLLRGEHRSLPLSYRKCRRWIVKLKKPPQVSRDHVPGVGQTYLTGKTLRELVESKHLVRAAAISSRTAGLLCAIIFLLALAISLKSRGGGPFTISSGSIARWTRRKVSTTSGSYIDPLRSMSILIASSSLRRGRYGRSEVNASKQSTTDKMRAPIGIPVPLRPAG